MRSLVRATRLHPVASHVALNGIPLTPRGPDAVEDESMDPGAADPELVVDPHLRWCTSFRELRGVWVGDRARGCRGGLAMGCGCDCMVSGAGREEPALTRDKALKMRPACPRRLRPETGRAGHGRRFRGAHRDPQEEGRDPPEAHHPDDTQRAKRPSGRLHVRRGHRHGLVLSCAPRRSEESDVARPGSIRPEQGPRVSRVVRGLGGARLLPRRRAADLPQAEQPPPGASGTRDDAGRRERRGRGGPRPLLLRRARPRGPDGSQAVAGVLHPRGRGAGRRADVGGRDGLVEVRPRQPDGVHRPERNPAGGPHGGHHAPRAARGEVGGVQLARPHNRRARLPPDPRGDRGGASHERPADRCDLPHRERQGRLLHGEQDQVSRGRDERRGAEARPGGARRPGGRDLTAGPWKMESQRSYFGRALIDLGRRNPNVVVVGADTTESIKTIDFGKSFPDRFFQLGIAEPNMISVAAGLAAAGKIAFAATYSVFGSAHTYNVIRQNVAYTNLNGKIFCSHAGLTVGPDGATHQMNEDIALMRGIPRMTVLVPAAGPETAKCVDAAGAMKGPV